MSEKLELTEQEKKMANVVEVAIDKKLDSNNKKFMEELKDNFDSELSKFASKEYTDNQLLELTEKLNESNKEALIKDPSKAGKAIALDTLVKSALMTETFQNELKEAKESGSKTRVKLPISEIMKGLNLYGAVSANGETDVNIWGTADQALALDNLFNATNAEFITGISLRAPFIFDYVSISRTNQPVFSFVEYLPEYLPSVELGYQIVPEGQPKPEQNLLATTSRVEKVLIAKLMKFTEQIWRDMPQIQNVVTNLLFEEFLLAREREILNYDSATNDLIDGIFNNAVPFDAATVSQPVQDAGLYQVIVALANQVNTAENYPYGDSYSANVAVVNPTDATYLIDLKLDADNNMQSESIYAALERRGIKLITSKSIPQGQILVGDLTKYQVLEYSPYQVDFGFVNDQFAHNQFTIRAEGEHFQFLPTLDKIAIVYDSIVNVQTLIS